MDSAEKDIEEGYFFGVKYMEPQIPNDIKQIAAFCDKWQVNEFYLFGSVLREDFNMNSECRIPLVKPAQ